MPAYSLTHVPCNDIRLRLGKVVEPLIIEDVPSPMQEEGVNLQHLSNMISIIEYDEHPTNVSDETQNNTPNDAHPTQLIRQPTYLERLMLTKVVGQPQFNLLGELKNIYVKIPLLKLFKTYLSMLELSEICAQGN